MTAQTLTGYLDELDQVARAASATEDAYRREAAARFRELEQERAFAFRRLNLMRSIVSAVTGAEDEAAAKERGSAAFMRELDWTGATESQRQTLQRFQPVIAAAWLASQGGGEEKVAAAARELSAFEDWYASLRNAPFLSLLEREVVELPLVEV